MQEISLYDRVYGGLLGGAVGDAFGAPYECVNYKNGLRIFKEVEKFEQFTAEMMDQKSETQNYEWINSVESIGQVTDDTCLSDLLLDCIIHNDGKITAYDFAREWENFNVPVESPDGTRIIRLDHCHFMERIPFYRNQLRAINKRELGQGGTNSTNAIMCISPVGLLCAGDPQKAEILAVEVTSVNQHGRSRDAAGGYAAALAACFTPGTTVEEIVETAILHTRDYKYTKEIKAIVNLARQCGNGKEFIERYWNEIIGTTIPLQDIQSDGSLYHVTWNSSEILGVTLAALIITKGEDPKEMILTCARIGRDADTICRCAGGLIGAFLGADAIPKYWTDFVLKKNQWLRLEEKAAKLTGIIEKVLKEEIEIRQKVLGT